MISRYGEGPVTGDLAACTVLHEWILCYEGGQGDCMSVYLRLYPIVKICIY